MGNSNSVLTVHSRIDAVLPHHVYELCSDEPEKLGVTERLAPVFPGGHKDRNQFVHSLRVLLSSNGDLPLGDMRFKLVFSRAPDEFMTEDETPQIYASIVAVSSDGVLAAKVVSARAADNKMDAFKSLRKTVEMQMHTMLEKVPGPGERATPTASSSASASAMQNADANISQSSLASTVLPDDPPSYQEASK